jgi:hypothetical protein
MPTKNKLKKTVFCLFVFESYFHHFSKIK